MAKNLADVPSLRPVLAVGAVLTFVAAFFGVRAAYSTALGVAIAAFDLYLIARMVGGLVGSAAAGSGGRIAVVVTIKSLLLFSVILLVVSGRVFSPLALFVGLLSLPLGISLDGILSARKERRD